MSEFKEMLELRPNQLAEFLYDQASYVNFDLPQYMDFVEILKQAKIKAKAGVGKRALDRAKKEENVNHIFITNKDGRYAWRRFEIINPLIYANLVNLISAKDNWLLIRRRFVELQSASYVECVSIPVLPANKKTQSATQVMRYLEAVEQDSIIQSLEYDYVYISDVTDCYGSIYTHSISWALHGREVAKEKRKYKDLLGNKIDHNIQAMRHGQTNGIPQGSVLMDFIAELVLTYADSLLSEEMRKRKLYAGFKIIRYRDDYRIFTNNTKQGELILKLLNEVLLSLGMRLNTSKTKSSDDVITSSIKVEKVFFMDKPLKRTLTRHEMRKELLLAYKYSKQYPNSSQISKRIKHLRDRYSSKVNENPMEYISILTNIALDNPVCIPASMAFISRILEKRSKEDQLRILSKIKIKLEQLPNCGYLEVWLQRLTIKIDPDVVYAERLCQLAIDPSVRLFDETWVEEPQAKALFELPAINRQTIENLNFAISDQEVDLFRELIPS